MRWIKETTVKNAAKRGPKAAHKMAIRHWKQLHEATLEELITGIISGVVNIGHNYCALCDKYYNIYHRSCSCHCPLSIANDGCSTKYDIAASTFEDLLETCYNLSYHLTPNGGCHIHILYDALETNFKAWKQASGRMLKSLQKEYEKRYETV